MHSIQRLQKARVVGGLLLSISLCGCDALNQLLGGVDTIPTTAAPNQVGLQLVASGFTSPLGLVSSPDGTGRRFVFDQIGKVFIIDSGGSLLPTPFLDIGSRMVTIGIDFGGGIIFDERGLLSIAFHPNFASNGRFFVFYTAPKGADLPADFNAESHVSEFKVSAADANVADPASERLLLRIGKPEFNHNGGQLAFGRDGMLYIGVGDGGNANDDDGGIGHNPIIGNGQDKTTFLGKLLRIDVNNGDPYEVPANNPFIADATTRPEIFAMGFRNPWRFSFDLGGTGRLFVADVGQDLFEELDIVTSGGNYGWRVREGRHCFSLADPGAPPASCATADADGRPLIDPILEYSHPDASASTQRSHRSNEPVLESALTVPDSSPRGIAVIGGYVYRGSAVPDLKGHYFFGDFTTDFVTPDGSLFVATEAQDAAWTFKQVAVAGQTGGRLNQYILGFGQDNQGEVYVLTTDNVGPFGTTGKLYQVVSAP